MTRSELESMAFYCIERQLANELPNDIDLGYEICAKITRQFFDGGYYIVAQGIAYSVEYYVRNYITTIRELIKAHVRSAEQLKEKSTGELTEVLF